MNKKIRIFFSRLVIATQLVQLLSPAIVLAADNMCNVNPGTCVTPEQWEKGWGDARKQENAEAVAKQDEWTNANDSAPEIIREAGESNDVNRSQKAADAGHAPPVNAAVSEREDKYKKEQKIELRQENAVTRAEERQQRQEERRQDKAAPAPVPAVAPVSVPAAEKPSDIFCNYCGGFWANPKGSGCQAQAVERTKSGQCGDAPADAAATKPAVVGAQCLNANGTVCGKNGYGTVDIDDDGDDKVDRTEVLQSSAPLSGQTCLDGKEPIGGRCWEPLPQAPEAKTEAPKTALGAEFTAAETRFEAEEVAFLREGAEGKEGQEGIAKVEPKLMPPTAAPMPTQRLKDEAAFPTAAPTAGKKQEICRPGIGRNSDGGCAETFKQETETIRVGGGKFGQEMTVTTTSYCSGDSAVTRSRRSDGVESSSSTACEWGCSAGACREATPEEAQVWRYSVLQNAIEREQIACQGRAGGDSRDAGRCTATAVYDKAINNLQAGEPAPIHAEIFDQAGRSDTVRQAISDDKYEELLRQPTGRGRSGGVPLTEEQKAELRKQADAYAEEVVSTGSLNAAGYNTLSADSQVWDKISNVSAEEAEGLVDQQGWLGGIIADNLFCAVNNNYRASGACGIEAKVAPPRSDEAVEDAQGFWSFLVAGKSEQTLWDQGMIFGDPRSAGYQAREYEDKVAPACGVHIWQRSLTEGEKACLTGQSVAAKARIAEVDEQNAQMAAMNIGSVALGFAGGAAAAGIKGAGLAAQAGRVVVGSGALSDAVIAVGMAEAMTAGDLAAANTVEAMSRAEGISETERETWSDQAAEMAAQADEAYKQNVMYGALFAVVGNVAGEVGMPVVGKAASEALGETPIGRLLFGNPRAAAGAAEEMADGFNAAILTIDGTRLVAGEEVFQPEAILRRGGVLEFQTPGGPVYKGEITDSVRAILENPLQGTPVRTGDGDIFVAVGDGTYRKFTAVGGELPASVVPVAGRVVTENDVLAVRETVGQTAEALADGEQMAVVGGGLLPAGQKVAEAVGNWPVRPPEGLFEQAAQIPAEVGGKIGDVAETMAKGIDAMTESAGGVFHNVQNAAEETAKAVSDLADSVSGKKPAVDLEGPMAPPAKSTKEAFPEAGSVEVVPKGGGEPYRVDYDPNNPSKLDSLKPGDMVDDVNGQGWIKNEDGTWSSEKLGVGGGEGSVRSSVLNEDISPFYNLLGEQEGDTVHLVPQELLSKLTTNPEGLTDEFWNDMMERAGRRYDPEKSWERVAAIKDWVERAGQEQQLAQKSADEFLAEAVDKSSKRHSSEWVSTTRGEVERLVESMKSIPLSDRGFGEKLQDIPFVRGRVDDDLMFRAHFIDEWRKALGIDLAEARATLFHDPSGKRLTAEYLDILAEARTRYQDKGTANFLRAQNDIVSDAVSAGVGVDGVDNVSKIVIVVSTPEEMRAAGLFGTRGYADTGLEFVAGAGGDIELGGTSRIVIESGRRSDSDYILKHELTHRAHSDKFSDYMTDTSENAPLGLLDKFSFIVGGTPLSEIPSDFPVNAKFTEWITDYYAADGNAMKASYNIQVIDWTKRVLDANRYDGKMLLNRAALLQDLSEIETVMDDILTGPGSYRELIKDQPLFGNPVPFNPKLNDTKGIVPSLSPFSTFTNTVTNFTGQALSQFRMTAEGIFNKIGAPFIKNSDSSVEFDPFNSVGRTVDSESSEGLGSPARPKREEGGLKQEPVPTMALPEAQSGGFSNLSQELDGGLLGGNLQQLGVRPGLENHFRFKDVPQNLVGTSEVDAVKYSAGVDFVNPLSENMAFEVRQGNESVFLVPVLRENGTNDWTLYVVDTDGKVRQADELASGQLDALGYGLSNRAQKGARIEVLGGVRLTLTPSRASEANTKGSLYRASGNIFYYQVGENVVSAKIRPVPIKMVREALNLPTVPYPKSRELPGFPDAYPPIREAEMRGVISGSGDNEFRLPSGARIGRDSGADLTVADLRVSRDHARIIIANDGKVIIEDRSRNGIFVNGYKVDGRTILKKGDIIRLGKSEESSPALRFEGVINGEAKFTPIEGEFNLSEKERLPLPTMAEVAGVGAGGPLGLSWRGLIDQETGRLQWPITVGAPSTTGARNIGQKNIEQIIKEDFILVNEGGSLPPDLQRIEDYIRKAADLINEGKYKEANGLLEDRRTARSLGVEQDSGHFVEIKKEHLENLNPKTERFLLNEIASRAKFTEETFVNTVEVFPSDPSVVVPEIFQREAALANLEEWTHLLQERFRQSKGISKPEYGVQTIGRYDELEVVWYMRENLGIELPDHYYDRYGRRELIPALEKELPEELGNPARQKGETGEEGGLKQEPLPTMAAAEAGQRLSEESEIQQQQSNHRQAEGNSGFQVEIDDGIAKISDGWLHDNNFLNMNAANKQIVANKKLIVNNANLNFGFRLGSGVMTIPAMNQPAERLTNQSDARANQISTGRNIIKSVAAIQSIVNQRVSAAGGSGGPVGFGDESEDQSRNSNDCSYQIELVNCQQSTHRVSEASLAQRKLAHHSTRASINPQYTPELSILSNPWNIGIANVAKNNNPRLLNNSESLSSWDGIRKAREGITGEFSIGLKQLSIVSQVYAADRGGGRIMPLSMYRALAGQVLFRKAVAGMPENERTAEKIGEAALAAAAMVNSIPKTGTLSSNEAGYSAVSGTEGIVAGTVGKGIYRVKADAVAGLDLTVPEKVNVGVNGDGAVMVGVTEGKGRVKVAGGLEWWQRPMLRLGEWIESWTMDDRRWTMDEQQGTVLAAETETPAATIPLTVQLFIDENKNGKMDEGEEPAKLAGVKVNLVAETKTVSYKLTEGWNFVAFPVAPESVKTAAELIQDAALDGGYVTTVATWEGDKWMEFSQRGGQKFGQDFELQPGRAYFLNSHKESIWTLAGTPLPAENRTLQLRKGWNGVGLPEEKVTTAVQILDEIQSVGEVSQTSQCEVCETAAETADQMAKWDYGLWDVVVKRRYSAEHHEIYGRDFPVKPEEGYFVHANEDVILR